MAGKMIIDANKVRKIVYDMGEKLTEASTAMGYCDTILNNAIGRGYMTLPLMVAFQNHTGKTYDDFKPDEPEPQETVTEPQAAPSMSTEDITHAVYKAISSAAELYSDNIREMLISSVSEAVFQGIQQAVGRYKKDLMQDIRGSIFSAVYQANQKLQSESKNDEVRKTWVKDA